MTSPTRSPLAQPDGFPDPEALVADILGAIEVNGSAIGVEQVDTDVSNLDAPCVQAYVPPGRRQLGRYGDLETTFVYVGAWGRDRDEAQAMQSQARRILEQYRDGGLRRGVHLFRVREGAGPAEIPQRPDAPDRLVEAGWTLQLRRHRGERVDS